jgi:gliding motility-associated-like protein
MKKNLYTFILLVVVSYNLFSQGAPACPAINVGGGTNTCPGQCVPLTASVVTTNQTTSYNVATIPYSPYPFVGTAVLNGIDDHWADSAAIGFNFCYFGNTYSQMCIGSNGEITFDLNNGNPNSAYPSLYNGYTINSALPNTTDLPGNTICGAFRDIDPSVGGDIFYQYIGVAPCRALVVSWVDVPLFSASCQSGGMNSTFQIVLYENTNYIDVYLQNSTSCTAWNGGYGIIGIQDAAGATAVVPGGRNYPSTWTATNEAWRFSPSGVPSYTVTWTDPAGVIGTGLNVNACPLVTTTYTATMVLQNCAGPPITYSSTTTVSVTPGTAVTVNSPTICAGSGATVLTATGSPTYTWSANAGGVNTSTVSVNPVTTTVYTVTGQGGGGGGCTPIATSTVTVIPSITVTVNTPAAICAGTNATLTANGATNYTWMPGGLTTQSVVVSPAATTVYTVTGVTGACPAATATTTVNIIPAVTVNSATVCSGTTATLTAAGGVSYTWTPGGSTGSSITVSPAATSVYTVDGGGGGTCSIAQSTVTVVPSLTVTVNTPPTVCAGVTTTLTANGAATYAWAPPTGLSATTGSVVTATPNTTTTYTVTGSSGACPPATAVTTASIIPTATITVSSATICPTTSATLTAAGGTIYNWSPGVGLSSTTGASVVANPPSSTVYTVTGGACDLPGMGVVTVTPGCTITVNSSTICPNGTTTLTAGGGGPYTWAPAAGLSATVGASVTANPATTTVYTVTSSVMGFTSTATSTVVVSASPTISVNNATVCQGVSTVLTAQGAASYVWSPSTGLSATTTTAVVATPSVTTTYMIVGTSTNSCTNTTFAIVGVNPMPTVTITPLNAAGCQPLCVQFSGLSSTTLLTYNWAFGDGATSSSSVPTYCYNSKGVFTPTLTLTDANNCVGSATSTVTVYAQPHADFGVSPQPISILEPTIQFTDQTTNGPATIWNWSFGVSALSSDTSHIKNPKYTYQDTGTYVATLWVSTIHGCVDSTTRTIKIDDDYELFVPGGFTPNGDGLNETFLPVTRGVIADSYHLYVYDRWGNLIFQTSEMYKGWDGTKHGTVVQEDVYVWKILLKTTNGTKKQVHGQVSLIK